MVSKRRSTLNVCAVKAPYFGDRRRAMFEDIAILTGSVALERAGKALTSLKGDGDVQIGISIIERASEEPLR